MISMNKLVSKSFIETATAEDVRKEIENGADVHMREKDGFTALMIASKYGKNHEVLSFLREHEAT